MWMLLSVLIHAALFLTPARLFELVFPQDRVTSSEGPRDLTPDFAEISLSIIPLPEEPPPEVPMPQPLDMEKVQLQIDPQPKPTVSAKPGDPKPADDRHGLGEDSQPNRSHFFPPRPRLIVPPTLEDLDVSVIRINLRILVDKNGYPEKVVLPDSLTDDEIRKRLLESAMKFRFEPARKGDLPVTSWIDLPLVFESTAAD
jgi:outer membrane biosynthesis protein TonB